MSKGVEAIGSGKNGLQFSLVIPFFNEEENVEPILREAWEFLPEAEIIAVDDGSTDKTWSCICSFSQVRGFRLQENRGQSAAIYVGLRKAGGSLMGLMDGDGQNDPRDFAKLISMLEEEQLDVVCGYRAERKDSLSKRVSSRIANRIRRIFLRDGVRDTGCSVKVFRREAVAGLVPFNGMHRYLPAFFIREGLRIGEIPVNHRSRQLGKSKYSNWDRAQRGVYDLIGVSWLLRRKVDFPKIEQS